MRKKIIEKPEVMDVEEINGDSEVENVYEADNEADE